jgi:hypothetical protein
MPSDGWATGGVGFATGLGCIGSGCCDVAGGGAACGLVGGTTGVCCGGVGIDRDLVFMRVRLMITMATIVANKTKEIMVLIIPILVSFVPF